MTPFMTPLLPKVSQEYRTPITPNATPMAEDIIIAINKIRVANKLPALIQDKRLTTSANEKAQDMVKRGYWSHADPNGNMPWDNIKKNGYDFQNAGENLANKYDDQKSVQEWMMSPSHRDNILKPEYTDVGIGRAGDYHVMHFGKEKK